MVVLDVVAKIGPGSSSSLETSSSLAATRGCSEFWVGSKGNSVRKLRSSASSGDSSGFFEGNAARRAAAHKGVRP